jgi:hypothetical protein
VIFLLRLVNSGSSNQSPNPLNPQLQQMFQFSPFNASIPSQRLARRRTHLTALIPYRRGPSRCFKVFEKLELRLDVPF